MIADFSKTRVTWLLGTALIFVMAASAVRAAESQGFTTKAPRAALMDATTGEILFQRNADELAPPASLSKLMTLAVLFKAMKDRKSVV